MEGFIFGGAYLRRETLRFKIDWASLIVASKFIVFALFYFVPEGNFLSTSPWGAYIWRGDLTEGFSCYRFRGLIFGILGIPIVSRELQSELSEFIIFMAVFHKSTEIFIALTSNNNHNIIIIIYNIIKKKKPASMP